MKQLDVLITADQIEEKVKSIAKQISEDYKGKEPVIICTLKGAIYFFSDIIRNLDIPFMMDFAKLSSYRNGTTSGEMQLICDVTTDIEGKDVIICEDIVDSGNTLAFFTKLLKEKNPASVKIASFLSKPSRRQVPIDIDYLGFEIEDKFVIGYGLDYAERFRELPYVAQINSPADLED